MASDGLGGGDDGWSSVAAIGAVRGKADDSEQVLVCWAPLTGSPQLNISLASAGVLSPRMPFRLDVWPSCRGAAHASASAVPGNRPRHPISPLLVARFSRLPADANSSNSPANRYKHPGE